MYIGMLHMDSALRAGPKSWQASHISPLREDKRSASLAARALGAPAAPCWRAGAAGARARAGRARCAPARARCAAQMSTRAAPRHRRRACAPRLCTHSIASLTHLPRLRPLSTAQLGITLNMLMGAVRLDLRCAHRLLQDVVQHCVCTLQA